MSILPLLTNRLYPPRCISRRPNGSGCTNRVEAEGQRCDSCWEIFCADDSIELRLAAARDKDLPTPRLRQLSQDRIQAVRMAIAERPDVPGDVQLHLASNALPVVRLLAANSSLTAEARKIIENNPDPYLQQILQNLRESAGSDPSLRHKPTS